MHNSDYCTEGRRRVMCVHVCVDEGVETPMFRLCHLRRVETWSEREIRVKWMAVEVEETRGWYS